MDYILYKKVTFTSPDGTVVVNLILYGLYSLLDKTNGEELYTLEVVNLILYGLYSLRENCRI